MPYNNSYFSGAVDPSLLMGQNGVVVTGNGSSNSSLQKIINSGVPITGGSSAPSVSSSAALMNSLAGLNVNFNGLFDLIKENTAFNNAWSAAQAQKQMDFQTQTNQIAMDFNASEAAKNRDWQQMMSNTSHQREIADLKAAGLNPVLSVMGGNGAPVTSGSAASGVTSSGSQADADQSANTALAAVYGALLNAQTSMYNANLSAKTNLAMAQMQTEAQMYGSQLASEASKYAAGTNYAAQVYGYNNQAQMQQNQLKWNSNHPQNVWQYPASLFGNEGISGALQLGKTGGSVVKSIYDYTKDQLKQLHEKRKNS